MLVFVFLAFLVFVLVFSWSLPCSCKTSCHACPACDNLVYWGSFRFVKSLDFIIGNLSIFHSENSSVLTLNKILSIKQVSYGWSLTYWNFKFLMKNYPSFNFEFSLQNWMCNVLFNNSSCFFSEFTGTSLVQKGFTQKLIIYYPIFYFNKMTIKQF